MSNERKRIFLTSDLHIGHENCLKFDNRPFHNLEHMHEVIANNYNTTVPENGVCYFLGDVGLANSKALSDFMKRLNGSTKILISGNHDKNTHSMYKIGFDVVLNAAVIYIGKYRVSMSHCPLPGIFREDVSKMKHSAPGEMWHGEFKNQMFTSYDTLADYHLHGHIHSNDIKTPVKTTNQFDIGVVGNKFRPVSLSQVESWITLEENKKLTSSIKTE